MYMRFVVGNDSDSHRELIGVITYAALLLDQADLYDYEEQIVQECFQWLNSNVPCPPYETSNWPTTTFAWFRDDANDAIAVMRQLSLVLSEHGYSVRVLRTENPGKIYYQDNFQVVTENWKQLNVSKSVINRI